jgi:hypothetical protein
VTAATVPYAVDAQAPAGRNAAAPFTSAQAKAAMDKYCVTCHNPRTNSGGLTIDSVDFTSVLRHLNRTEYANAIRDLLDLNVDVSALLPADNSSYGFDNIADVLVVSPVLVERYLTAARRISAVAVGDAAEIPVTAE